MRLTGRRCVMGGAAILGVLWACGSAALASESPVAIAAVSEPVSNEIWSAASQGREDTLARTLADVSSDDRRVNDSFRGSVELFETNLEKRETLRAEKIAEVSAELDEEIAGAKESGSAVKLSHAMASAVELQLLIDNDTELFAQKRMNELIDMTEQAARKAESRGDWLIANELYFRLNTLLDEERAYDDDVQRLGSRLSMIRLYAPERLWELRNERRLAEEDTEPLPPYNPYGDDYRQKLQGIDPQMVYRALLRASRAHVGIRTPDNPSGVTMGTLLEGGLDSLETLATTADLRTPFAGLRDDHARDRFVGTVRSLRDMVDRDSSALGYREMKAVVERLLDANRQTIRLLDEAVLHEFANGAMGELDDYTAIIWPDELARFRRTTQGEFIGVGIQIQLDELQNIKVVTPLEGTPAQRAGIQSDDVIKKVDGVSALGLSLDQAVEIITGKPDTQVTLTVEREDDEGNKRSIDFDIVRKRIDLPSVKGWRKTGAGDRDWDWFIDHDAGIGYIRLTGFTEDTTRDFDIAIADMRRRGLSSLILDLRYNPGGLLDQAVNISSRFVERGLIVRTETAQGLQVGEPLYAERLPQGKRLDDIPVVVLINEGSASASEIVSGAIQAGAKQGKVQALVVGQRSFGKGSVQNVFALSGGDAVMKLTTQYYRIDSPRLIHREPGSSEWGIDPDLKVEMLPEQQVEALMLRRDADVLPLDENGDIIADAERPDPDTLLTDGIDLQVQTALVVLQSQNTDPLLRAASIEHADMNVGSTTDN